MILPLYIFTIIFVAGPLLYMLALSFAQPKAGHGVEWTFTLANYKRSLTLSTCRPLQDLSSLP